MSHISRIEIEIKDIPTLKAACRRLGLTFCPEQKTFQWFGREPSPCDHAIKVPGARYEIGVTHDGGRYGLSCDFYDPSIEKAIGPQGGRLKQAYAVAGTTTEARRKGYSVIEKSTDTGIRLCVRIA